MRFSIRNRIFLCVVLIQVLSAALFVGWYFYSVNESLRALSRDNAQETVLRAVASTKGFFGPPEALAKITSSLLAHGVLSPAHPKQFEKFLFELVRRSPNVFGLYVGYPDGAFFQVSRSDKEGVGGTRTRAIVIYHGKRHVDLTWRDQDFNVVKAENDVADPYDPRARPWYKEAAKRHTAVWTDPYIFNTGHEPGITMAVPVVGAKGEIISVIGVDVEVGDVSQFLTRVSMRTGGSALMVTANGDVIAYARHGQVLPVEQGRGTALRFLKVDDLPGVDGAISDVVLARGPQPSNAAAPAVIERDFKGQDYFVVAGGIGNTNWPWRVVAVAPEAAFLRVLRSGNELLLGLALLATALACLVGYLLANKIGKPLVILHRDAKFALQNNFGMMEETSSGYPEIDETYEILRTLASRRRERV